MAGFDWEDGPDLKLEALVMDGKYEFREGIYRGIDVKARKVQQWEKIPIQSGEKKHGRIVRFLEEVKYEGEIYLLYFPFLQTLEGVLEENIDILVEYGVEDETRGKKNDSNFLKKGAESYSR